jgi:hypothetical protein
VYSLPVRLTFSNQVLIIKEMSDDEPKLSDSNRSMRPLKPPRSRSDIFHGVDWKHQGLVLTGLFLFTVVGFLLIQPSLERAQMKANQELAIRELQEFHRASWMFAGELNIGGLVPLEILANPERHPIKDKLYLSPHFLLSVRNGYRFEFRGQKVAYKAPIQPSYESYVYFAQPLIPGKTGIRSFAIFASGRTVYTRSDGEIPTLDDETIGPASQ